MDYGKYTYLKLADIGDEYISSNQDYSINAVEYNHPVLNSSVNGNITLDICNLIIKGKTTLTNRLKLSTNVAGIVSISLIVNGVSVASEQHSLNIGENLLTLSKVINFDNVLVDFKLNIKTVTNNFIPVLMSNNFTAVGKLTEIEKLQNDTLRVLNTANNQLLISNIVNNDIFYILTNTNEQSFTLQDFTWLVSGISHCFAIHKSSNLIYLFRVDNNGNLYYSQFNSVLQEILIDTNVTDVYAREVNSELDEDILICYIKNDTPYYRTITGSTLSMAKNFSLPNTKYKKVYIVDSAMSNNMMIVCTAQSGSNYILTSVADTNLSRFTENINVNSAILVNRTIKFASNLTNIAENIDISISSVFKKDFINFDKLLNNKTENINAGLSLTISPYTIEQEEPEINYSLHFNQKTAYSASAQNVTYGFDAVNWQRATVNVSSDGRLVDNDNLLSKWPFNKIKPCLINNGVLVGYLNPNDYSKFEDGTNADIYSGNYDVMVQFPKIYYKIIEDWDGVCTLSSSQRAMVDILISNKYKDGYVCNSHVKNGVEYDYIYVGAYENNLTNGRLFCCSGKYPKTEIPHHQFLNNFSNYRNSQYGSFNYHFTTYLFILQMLLFGERKCSSIFGNGNVNSLANVKNSGTMDTYGLFYGVSVSSSAENKCQKFFGLENIMGNSKTFVDGVLYNSSGEFLVVNPYTTAVSINGTGYTPYSFNVKNKYYYGNVTLCAANNSYGFLPVACLSSSLAKNYYETYTKIATPSYYTNIIPGQDLDYMVFFFGGDYSSNRGMEICSEVDYDNSDQNFSERIICYPNDKISEGRN